MAQHKWHKELTALANDSRTIIEVRTESVYTIADDNGDIYRDQHTIQLKLGEDIISEETLD